MHALSSIMGLACWQFSEVQLSQYIEAGVGVWIIKGAVGCICTDTTVNLGDIRGLGNAWLLFSCPRAQRHIHSCQAIDSTIYASLYLDLRYVHGSIYRAAVMKLVNHHHYYVSSQKPRNK